MPSTTCDHPLTREFAYTGSSQTFRVPNHLPGSLRVTVAGAKGANAGVTSPTVIGRGGSGGSIRGYLDIAAGTTLHVTVGGKPADAADFTTSGGAGGGPFLGGEGAGVSYGGGGGGGGYYGGGGGGGANGSSAGCGGGGSSWADTGLVSSIDDVGVNTSQPDGYIIIEWCPLGGRRGLGLVR